MHGSLWHSTKHTEIPLDLRLTTIWLLSLSEELFSLQFIFRGPEMTCSYSPILREKQADDAAFQQRRALSTVSLHLGGVPSSGRC